MRRNIVWAIARKDMQAVTRSAKIWLGLVLLPLVLGVLLPSGVVLALRLLDLGASGDVKELLKLVDRIPFLQDSVRFPTDNHKLVYLFVNYMLGPFFLLIPVINAMAVAVNSFVGEKERRTLESMLLAPVETAELFAGKVLASFLPAYGVTLGGFVLCGAAVNGIAYGMFDRIIFPSANWLVMLLLVAPAFTVLAILVSVLVSARSEGFQEAQQVAGLVVLPIVAMIISQATGLMVLSANVLLIAGAVLIVLDLVLLRFIARMNDRQVLFERQVH